MATINVIHRWIEKRKPKPKVCEHCKINSPRDLSNNGHTYRRNIADYEWLCRKCHLIKDKRDLLAQVRKAQVAWKGKHHTSKAKRVIGEKVRTAWKRRRIAGFVRKINQYGDYRVSVYCGCGNLKSRKETKHCRNCWRKNPIINQWTNAKIKSHNIETKRRMSKAQQKRWRKTK